MKANEIYTLKEKHVPLFDSVTDPAHVPAVLVRSVTDSKVSFSVCTNMTATRKGAFLDFTESTFTIEKADFLDLYEYVGISQDAPEGRR